MSIKKERAPKNSLPTWSECQLAIDNYEYAKGEGGYDSDACDNLKPTALQEFIYEYDDADDFKSEWFMHRLEMVVNEAKRRTNEPD